MYQPEAIRVLLGDEGRMAATHPNGTTMEPDRFGEQISQIVKAMGTPLAIGSPTTAIPSTPARRTSSSPGGPTPKAWPRTSARPAWPRRWRPPATRPRDRAALRPGTWRPQEVELDPRLP